MKRMLAVFALFALLAIPAKSFAEDKIAVVNVSKVIFDAREFDDLKTAWSTKTAELEKDANNLKVDLQTKQKLRDDTLKPGNPDYEAMTLDLLKMQNERGYKLQLDQVMLANQQKQAMSNMVAKIRTAVEALAKEKGYTLVINDYKPRITEDVLNKMDVNQFTDFLLQSQTIMYTNTDTDITQAIVDRLDAEYSSSSPAKTE